MQSMLLSRLGFLIRHGRFMGAKRRAWIAASLCVEPGRIACPIDLPQRRPLELCACITEEFTVPIRVKAAGVPVAEARPAAAGSRIAP